MTAFMVLAGLLLVVAALSAWVRVAQRRWAAVCLVMEADLVLIDAERGSGGRSEE